MLTPKALENPQRASGYDNVTQAGEDIPKPYQARKHGPRLPGRNGGGVIVWRGPRRATAEEAAQDYCDYVNSGAVTPAKPALKSAGHAGKRQPLPDDPEIQAVIGVIRDARGRQAGNQGYVYCINEEHPGGGMRYVKVGYSTNPAARVGELQTGNPRPLRLHAMKKGTVEDEAALHRKYIQDNVLQEWFVPSKELLLEFDLGPDGKPWGSV